MLTKEAVNENGEQHWRLLVPDEYCAPGLEVGVTANENGLSIGGQLISWLDLEEARRVAERPSKIGLALKA